MKLQFVFLSLFCGFGMAFAAQESKKAVEYDSSTQNALALLNKTLSIITDKNLVEDLIKKAVTHNHICPDDIKLGDNKTALAYYVIHAESPPSKGDLAFIKFLLQNGANPNIIGLPPEQAPLLFAVRSVEIAELFVKHGANVQAKNAYDDTVLFALFEDKFDEELIHFYVKHGVDATAINTAGYNAFTYFLESAAPTMKNFKLLNKVLRLIDACVPYNAIVKRGPYSGLNWQGMLVKMENNAKQQDIAKNLEILRLQIDKAITQAKCDETERAKIGYQTLTTSAFLPVELVALTMAYLNFNKQSS